MIKNHNSVKLIAHIFVLATICNNLKLIKKMSRNNLGSKDTSFAVVAVTAVIIVVGLWIATIYIFGGWKNDDKSAFGEMFGSVNALFSGLALTGIILTILLQRKELSLQRQELKYTREELARTAKAQENSEKALNRQAENLKISAKLSALNTLVNFYSELEKNVRQGLTSSHVGLAEIIERKNRYVSRIEEILQNKEIGN